MTRYKTGKINITSVPPGLGESSTSLFNYDVVIEYHALML